MSIVYGKTEDNNIAVFPDGRLPSGYTEITEDEYNSLLIPIYIGDFTLLADDGSDSSKLVGTAAGVLTWGDENIVRSVNGVLASDTGDVQITTSGVDISGVVKSVNSVTPDENGNVTLDIDTSDLENQISQLDSATVKSVNQITPDTNGNVTIETITTPGNIIKWETDFFDIAANGTYSFDLAGTVFENEERSDINFQLVAKIKTGNATLNAGDIVFTDYSNYKGEVKYTEVGSYSYIRDKKLYIHFGNADEFVCTAADGSTYATISKTNVQCKIILTKVISGTNGELGATPKSVTNIVGVTDNRNLGETFYSALPLESSQVHLLDGSVLTDVTELYDYLESIQETNPNLFTTDAEYDSEVENTGSCSKFVLYTDSNSVRIPTADANNYIVIRSFATQFEFNQPFSLLEPKWSDAPLNNPSWLLSNGQENTSESYPSVYELLLNEYNNGELKTDTIGDTTIEYKQLNNGRKVVTDKTAYNTILESTGTAWYYLLDLDAKTFVLPQTSGYMKFGNSNEFIKESLPNIKGNFGYTASSGDDSTTAPFSKTYTSTYGAGSATTGVAKYTQNAFNASTYSSVYQDGANVNPNAVQGFLYFYVGEVVGTASAINLGNIKDTLDLEIPNIKTDISELKTDISSYAFPGTKTLALTIPTSGTTLVAPDNGWFVYQSYTAGSTNDYMFMRNTSNEFYACQTRDLSGRGVYVTLPAKKGESVYFEYTDAATTKRLKFIYASDKSED